MQRPIITAVVVGFLLVAGVSPTSATNWAGASGLSGCTGNNMTENSQVSIYYPNVSAPIKAAMESAGTYTTSATDLTISTTTSSTYDDVRVFDEYYTQLCGFQTAWGNYLATGDYSGVIGLAKCVAKHDSGSSYAPRCDRHYVYFDESTKQVLTSAELKANAVHELGHTLGLNHTTSSTSVMKTGNLGVSSFDSHDKGHLNAAY